MVTSAAQVFLDRVTVEESEIQGDVLVGLQKRSEVFLFFKMTDTARFKAGLDALVEQIATTAQTRDYEQNHGPMRMKTNIAFTASGLRKLAPSLDDSLLDSAFASGMKARAADLGDVLADWLPAYRAEQFDGVLLVAAWDRDPRVARAIARARAAEIVAAFGRDRNGEFVIDEAQREEGMVNRTVVGTEVRFGHEAFGFADGVSQPAVTGLHQPQVAPNTNSDQSHGGQDLIAVQDFVLAGDALPAVLVNGSYMVFRRLRQDVAAFDHYVAQNFAEHASSPEQFGARLIGRWRDGSPIETFSKAPGSAADEANPDANNTFTFGFTPPASPDQSRCPFNAHIRRVYPRDDVKGGPGDSEKRRILRAGIAYDYAESHAGDRGLLFVCYQSSIVDKFEFIQRFWANASSIPFQPDSDTLPSAPGPDLIIGQGATPRDATWGSSELKHVPTFVTSTGGEYFFSPSISSLKILASSQPAASAVGG